MYNGTSAYFLVLHKRKATQFYDVYMYRNEHLHGIGVCKQLLYDNVWGGCRINSDSDRTCV